MSNEFEEFAVMLEGVVKQLDSQMPDIISVSVMVELQAQHKQRIFGDGLNSEGQKIGEYNDDPNYYAKELFIRKGAFKEQGKDDVGVDKDGKKKKRLEFTIVDSYSGKKKNIAYVKKTGLNRKTMYLPGGYKEFRDIQGRQTEYVDIKFSGSAERGLNVVKSGNATLYGTTDLKESKKLLGNSERFGDFLSLTTNEQEFIKLELQNETKQIIEKYAKP